MSWIQTDKPTAEEVHVAIGRKNCIHECFWDQSVWLPPNVLLNRPSLATLNSSLVDWWINVRRGQGALKKGIDSSVMLVSWRIWKARNDVVFNRRSPTARAVMQAVMEEASQWIQAGASRLSGLVGQRQRQGYRRRHRDISAAIIISLYWLL